MTTIALAILGANRKDLIISTQMFFFCAVIDLIALWMVCKAIGGM